MEDRIYVRVLARPGQAWRAVLAKGLLGTVGLPLALALLAGILYFLLALLSGALIFALAEKGASPGGFLLASLFWPIGFCFSEGYALALACFGASVLAAVLGASVLVASLAQARDDFPRRVNLLLALFARSLWAISLPGFPIAFAVYAWIALPKAMARWRWQTGVQKRFLRALPGLAICLGAFLGSGLSPAGLIHPWAGFGTTTPRGFEQHRQELAELRKNPYVPPERTDSYLARADLPAATRFGIAMAKAGYDANSMAWVADCYDQGIGVPSNPELAASWRRKAIARDGSTRAKTALGVSLLEGRASPLPGEDGMAILESVIRWNPMQALPIVEALQKSGHATRNRDLEADLVAILQQPDLDSNAQMAPHLERIRNQCRADSTLWPYQCALATILQSRTAVREPAPSFPAYTIVHDIPPAKRPVGALPTFETRRSAAAAKAGEAGPGPTRRLASPPAQGGAASLREPRARPEDPPPPPSLYSYHDAEGRVFVTNDPAKVKELPGRWTQDPPR